MIPHRRWNNPFPYLTAFAVTLLLGCAPPLRPPTRPPFSQEQSAQLISHLREQGERTWSFQGVGRVRLREGERQSNSDLFAVGRKPFKVRLEVTHPWGRPLFHIVVGEGHISILSLTDGKFFTGPADGFEREKPFLFGLDLDSAWKILSGNVPVLAHDRAVSLKPGEITLYNRRGVAVEVISFFHEPLVPASVCLPGKRITVALSEFEQGDLGLYPSRIRLEKEGVHRSLELRYKSLKLNRPVPKEIFHVDPPPGFEIIPLGDLGSWWLADF